MSRLKVSILRNEDQSSGKKWELACEKKGIDYDVIDLTASNWYTDIVGANADFLLLRPSGKFEHYKTLYDERLYIICKVVCWTTFPSYEECYIYENKRMLSYFLKAKDIPHPETRVFYAFKEANQFINSTTFPIVAKTSIGASGSGVQILKDKRSANKYLKTAFSAKGIKRRFGPNRVTGSPKGWALKALKSPSFFLKKLKDYFAVYKHGQRDFVIFQKYIPHDFEWRVVKIGKSYFAHKKIKQNDKASGSKGIDYVNPPLKILNFVKELCEDNNFNFMAVDLFEDGKGGYLVNELQTIFGHVQDHIMAVDGIPGRYLLQNDQWAFESGDFNTNESYDLRLQTAIDLFEESKSNFQNKTIQ
jgi:glutathione synthase/RimK-type ligase-like ATP-grasp enzyme